MPPRKTLKMQPRKAATPAVREPGMTSEQKAQFLEALEESGSLILACEKLDVTHADFARAREADPDFRDEIDGIDRLVTEKLESKAYEMALKGNESLLRFMLTARKPEVYARKDQPATRIDINVVQSWSDDELNRVIQARMKNAGNG